MRITKYTILLVLVIILSSCTQRFSVLVRLLDMDSPTNDLNIEFAFKDLSLKKDVPVSNIKIHNNDTLLYELEPSSDSVRIVNWIFPSIPDGYKIVFPTNTASIQPYQKTDPLTFWFQSDSKENGGYSEWTYKPKYHDKANRWMFDGEGHQTIQIESYHENWVGKDIIKIYSNETINIDFKSIKLKNNTEENIQFSVKKHKEKDNLVFITLDTDIGPRKVINLSFTTEEGNYYNEDIITASKSSVGLIGKYQ